MCFEGVNMPMDLDICKRAIKEVTHSDLYKLNVDATGPNDVGSWGLSVVVRDSDGVVLAAVCWYRSTLRSTLPDFDIAESYGNAYGFNFAKDLLFLKLEAESNSTNIIEGRKDNNMHHSYLGAIVVECQNIRHNFNNINISHVRK